VVVQGLASAQLRMGVVIIPAAAGNQEHGQQGGRNRA
jgi:hypothetical protein